MSLSKSWVLHVDPGVLRTLKKIPRHDAEAILEVIQLLPVNPYFGDVHKIKGGDDVWRRRVGSYRIFYKLMIFEKIILVFHLERRTSKTY